MSHTRTQLNRHSVTNSSAVGHESSDTVLEFMLNNFWSHFVLVMSRRNGKEMFTRGKYRVFFRFLTSVFFFSNRKLK